jgi:hypothetical protein
LGFREEVSGDSTAATSRVEVSTTVLVSSSSSLAADVTAATSATEVASEVASEVPVPVPFPVTAGIALTAMAAMASAMRIYLICF